MFDLEAKRASVREKEAMTAEDGFWDDAEKARQHLKVLNDIKKNVELLDGMKGEIEDQAELRNKEKTENICNKSSRAQRLFLCSVSCMRVFHGQGSTEKHKIYL